MGASAARPATLLRVEGAALLVFSVLAYALLGESWVLFLALVLLPDLSMLGYLSGDRAGAASYNLAHTYLWPAALAGLGLLYGVPLLVSLALVWSSHVGFDRMMGFGLKYPTGFWDTHLGRMGRARRGASRLGAARTRREAREEERA